MAEYIEREALKPLEEMEYIYFMSPAAVPYYEANKVWEVLNNIPAADVAPVVHGWWIPSESDFDDDDVLFDVEDWCDWQCSACHEDICYEDPMERRWLPKFCPNCGANMDVTDINVGNKGGESHETKERGTEVS